MYSLLSEVWRCGDDADGLLALLVAGLELALEQAAGVARVLEQT